MSTSVVLKPAKSRFYDGEKCPQGSPFKLIIQADGKDVGYIEAFKINRRAAVRTGDFHLSVEHWSQDIYDFAKALFEQFSGNLRPILYQGRPFQRGTECFGQEVNNKNIIYIEEIVIESKADRRRGFGTAAFAELHERCHATHPFIFVRAATLTAYPGEGTMDQQIDLLVTFFRKSHYRRVGNTEYFAFAQDINHPSRCLPAENDAPGPPRGQRPPSEMPLAFPFHVQVVDGPARCPDLFTIIKNVDIAQIHLQDDYGATPLHIAAAGGKFLVAMAIMERSTDELFVRNTRGETPLDRVDDKIAEVTEASQEFMLDMGTRFNLPRDKLVLEISTIPLQTILRELMDYIDRARENSVDPDVMQGHIQARITTEKAVFERRIKARQDSR